MRQYVPKIKTKVKLKLYEHYSELDEQCNKYWRARFRKVYDECCAAVDKGVINLEESEQLKATLEKEYAEYRRTHDEPGVWAWFEVVGLSQHHEPRSVMLKHICRAVGAPDPAWQGLVPLDQIEPPLGWQPVYTMVCVDKAKADTVVSEWFKRGIHVWTSADLSSGGRAAFTPFNAGGATETEPASPHWQFTSEPTESIPAELCPDLFIVKVLEEWEPKLPSGKKEKAVAVKALRAEPGVTVEYIKGERMWLASRETTVYQPKEEEG